MSHSALNRVSAEMLAEAADINLVVHASWVLERTPGMHVVNKPDLVLTDSGLPCDTFNLICRTRLTKDHAPQRIQEAIGFFSSSGRPFSWWVEPADQPPNLRDLLVGAGLIWAESELAMAADLSALREHDLAPNGLEIQRVHTTAQLQEFARIVAANWDPPDVEVLHFYELAAPALLLAGSPQWLYVGYLAGEPVATAELVVGGGVVGLYNICTLKAYRRRGIGTALTLRPLLDARDNGYHTGILQAAAGGVNIYRRLGFVPFGDITEYKPPAV